MGRNTAMGANGMTVSVSQLREEMVDREAIRDCLFRYSRGVDRADEEMLRSVYWEDAHDEHLIFSGDREEFISWVMPKVKSMTCFHMLGNMMIRVHGDHADAETYFYSYHVPKGEGTVRDFVTGGRYLDRLEKRDDHWRIATRVVVLDWFRDYPDTGDWTKGPAGMPVEPSSRMAVDLSYSMLKMS
jgi:hypothetical protein